MIHIVWSLTSSYYSINMNGASLMMPKFLAISLLN